VGGNCDKSGSWLGGLCNEMCSAIFYLGEKKDEEDPDDENNNKLIALTR
jgi:hypothetical protein